MKQVFIIANLKPGAIIKRTKNEQTLLNKTPVNSLQRLISTYL